LEKSGWLQASTSKYKGSSKGAPFKSPVVSNPSLPEGSSLPIKVSDQRSPLLLTPLPIPTDLTFATLCPFSSSEGSTHLFIFYLTLPFATDQEIEPGYREPEEGDSSLGAVLDHLFPFLRDNSDAIKLPTFIGKPYKAIWILWRPVPLSNLHGVKGKEYAWSRGLGVELSPIKTRSSRKKLAQPSPVTDDSVPSSTDSGALRAMKALAREK
jgi:hypothetical protein